MKLLFVFACATVFACAAALALPLADAQTPAMQAGASTSIPSFSVITVKPSKGGGRAVGTRTTADGFHADNITVRQLLLEGFGVSADQILGEPAWTATAGFDIDAKVAPADVETLSRLSPEERSSMIQQVLTGRFGLAVHHESRDLTVAALAVAPGGLRIKRSAAGRAHPGAAAKLTVSPGRIVAQAAPIASLVSTLASLLQCDVLDQTGLSGNYDFTLEWTPTAATGAAPPGSRLDPKVPPPPTDGPDLYSALQDQLGLKLDSSQGPTDVLFIDHIEKPAEN